jgi:2,5-diketo-D-gluconate reductase B
MSAITLPPVGLGTYSDTNHGQWHRIVRVALSLGYRHFDTGSVYENEQHVGTAVASADIDREELWLATKTVHPDTVSSPNHLSQRLNERLRRLGVEYVDVLYVHWPLETYEPTETLPWFRSARSEGQIRHIGVSNFTCDQLDTALDILGDTLAVHQAEFHPLLPQHELVDHAQHNDYTFVAHTPLAKGRVREVSVLCDIAKNHGVSPEVVSLAWVTSHDNVVAIPKARSREHLMANLRARNLKLNQSEHDRIASLSERVRVVGAPHLE